MQTHYVNGQFIPVYEGYPVLSDSSDKTGDAGKELETDKHSVCDESSKSENTTELNSRFSSLRRNLTSLTSYRAKDRIPRLPPQKRSLTSKESSGVVDTIDTSCLQKSGATLTSHVTHYGPPALCKQKNANNRCIPIHGEPPIPSKAAKQMSDGKKLTS